MEHRDIVVKSFLMEVLDRSALSIYDKIKTQNFYNGFSVGATHTLELVNLINYSSTEGYVAHLALEGFKTIIKRNVFDESYFREYSHFDFEDVFPEIIQKPTLYGTVKGIDMAAEVVTLGRYGTHDFILCELERFRKSKL